MRKSILQSTFINAAKLGYSKTKNKGNVIKETGLLKADKEVTDGWLGRFMQ